MVPEDMVMVGKTSHDSSIVSQESAYCLSGVLCQAVQAEEVKQPCRQLDLADCAMVNLSTLHNELSQGLLQA